ncbi:MAG TPA: pyridoxine 5'-phosphate synthase [Gemmatimonadaceae bacterium]|nr:pyridoxine 5'-phosphate synthase [Gemmatimonadaceae bacterium]
MPSEGNPGRDSSSPRTARHQRLYVNIDHVATLRQARRGSLPDPVEAARWCEDAGADGITVHLREDRRHIQDADVDTLATTVRTVLNLEMACTDEMLAIALRLRPHQVTIVPERRAEITTEGGLDVRRDPEALRRTLSALNGAGIRTALFIDPDLDIVRASQQLGAVAVELHTGQYAHHPGAAAPIRALAAAAEEGARLGLGVHAGHGLAVPNVAAVAAIEPIEELNIGHALIGRSILIGIAGAIHELRAVMNAARGTIA